MGAMNAMGHVTLAIAAGSDDALWDLAAELCSRLGREGVPGLHAFTPAERRESRLPRYCFHPDGTPGVEFRGEKLREALSLGVVWLARQMPEAEMWRPDDA